MGNMEGEGTRENTDLIERTGILKKVTFKKAMRQVSVVIANMVMEHVEEQALSSHRKCSSGNVMSMISVVH